MTQTQVSWPRIERTDPQVALATRRRMDAKTKPLGSLGKLEELACRLAAISGNVAPPLPDKAVVVMGADHGVAAAQVSAYPQAVTAQMLLNFASGGAALNVLARQASARVVVVDMGVAQAPAHHPAIVSERIAAGTANFLDQPAMAPSQACQAVQVGIQIASQLVDKGVGLLGIGEMGIGNTTAASALTAVYTGSAPREVTGRGTGIDAATLRHKVEVVEAAIARHSPDTSDWLDPLSKLGGFEIAGLCGVVLGAAAHRCPVLLDGFIASVAALAAVRACPAAADYLIASHLSSEPGHGKVLQALDQGPLLDLDLRLGEGTGAVLAMHLTDAALHILHEMATFEEAGVSAGDQGAR